MKLSDKTYPLFYMNLFLKMSFLGPRTSSAIVFTWFVHYVKLASKHGAVPVGLSKRIWVFRVIMLPVYHKVSVLPQCNRKYS